MSYKNFIRLTFCLGLGIVGCSKDDSVPVHNSVPDEVTPTEQEAVSLRGATQVSGLGFYPAPDECNAVEDASYALKVIGDLDGCVYVFVEAWDCSPSGTYRETGREYWVVTFNEGSGTFWTNYRFEGKFEGCSEDGSYVGAEILGRCQHPIEAGSGTGVFEGVTGRIDFKDDIEAGNFPYRGHLSF